MLMAAAILRMGHKQEQERKLMIDGIHKLANALEGFVHCLYDGIRETED
jgi:hypothetical protein